MDTFTPFLLGFLSIAFLLETTVLIGVFIHVKHGNCESLSIIKKIHKLMDKWDNDGQRWKKMGEIYMLFGAGATALEVGHFFASTNISIPFINELLTLFSTISPGLAIAGIGMAIYAFGVNLIDSQLIKTKLEQLNQ